MAIFRSKRPERNFTTLPNELINDEHLSWEARGLLIFILSKPDHWEVKTSHLIKQTANSRKQSKRDSVRAILKELEDAGYVRRSMRRESSSGRFGGVDYIVYETPSPASNQAAESHLPETDLPETDLPETDLPTSVNPPLVSTEGLEKTETSETTETSIVATGDKSPVAAAAQGDLIPAGHDKPIRPRIGIPDDMPGPKDQNAKTFRPWANYAMAYRHRYGAWPIWNAKVAGQFAQLVSRVGIDLAPSVAAWYVRTNNQHYASKGHPTGLMLMDCEVLAVQCQTGRQITRHAAMKADATQSNLDIADEVEAMIRAGSKGNGQ